jgi:uncharacterized HhH-GPD family protein
MSDVKIVEIRPIGEFDFRWPDADEHYEHGWEGTASDVDRTFTFRVGLASRIAYGRPRTRVVTWINGAVIAEGVAADDFDRSRALLSLVFGTTRKLIRSLSDVPPCYADFNLCDHASEIVAPYSRSGIAAKIRADDPEGWVRFAVARLAAREMQPASVRRERTTRHHEIVQFPPSLVPVDETAIVAAMLAYGDATATEPTEAPVLTPETEANELVVSDPFAFLLGVLFDQNIAFERAWRAPLELKLRLGYLDPERIMQDPRAVAKAVQASPKLHRYVNNMPAWVVLAADRVLTEYGGDAARIWAGSPTARELRSRFSSFVGIGQKKSAMAVEILARDLKVPVTVMDGSDIAVDIHVRRVFSRSGLTDRDDVDEIVAAARRLHPSRPGALDLPIWRIGQGWCHPADPDCPSCPLSALCPQLCERKVI